MAAMRWAFGNSSRTWLSGWAIGALLIGGTAMLEAVYLSGDTWQYLATVVFGYLIVMAWSVAGAAVGIAALLRSRLPVVEPIVHALLCVTIVLAVVAWTWFAVSGIAANSW